MKPQMSKIGFAFFLRFPARCCPWGRWAGRFSKCPDLALAGCDAWKRNL